MSLTVVTQIAPADDLDLFSKMLKSVQFADNLTVYAMDMPQNHKLLQLAQKYRLELIHISAPTVVEAIRDRQVKQARGDWVLVMDFDEIITAELQQEILTTIKSSPTHSAYQIVRQNFSLGYPLQYGGWGDDYVIRLFKQADFFNWPTEIHSTPTFKGSLGKLEHYLEHHKDQSLSYVVNKTNRYTDKEASQYLEGGLKSVTSFTLLRKLHMEMIRRGIFKRGLLDGKIGLIQSIYQGFSVFMSYAKLYELHQKQHSSR